MKDKFSETMKRVMGLFLAGKNQEALAAIPRPVEEISPEDEIERRYTEQEALLMVDAARIQAAWDTRRQLEAQKRIELSDRLRREVETWFECKRASGEIPEAWEKNGLLEFMRFLDADSSAFQFSEDGESQTKREWMKMFLSELPKLVDVATIDRSARNAKYK